MKPLLSTKESRGGDSNEEEKRVVDGVVQISVAFGSLKWLLLQLYLGPEMIVMMSGGVSGLSLWLVRSGGAVMPAMELVVQGMENRHFSHGFAA
ncbi:hypothetical protein C5167_021988 [Papaver somniferum]|uniref:Uncharacterized protein n=1 Tax=Papaver somniferum TaxID=3469 RepID=A0A4Y7JGL0_PAPSO|nr:hypothetical protein C5167_021988 [Papaver somniferum]